MNALGTVAALKSLLGGGSGGAGGKINKFMSEIRSSGVMRTNLFEVRIGCPNVIAGNPTAAKISLYAESSSIPGRNIQTDEFAPYGYGPRQKFPYTMQYQDLTLQIIGDGKGDVYKFFHNWMMGIVRGDADIGSYGSTQDKNGKTAYEVEYKNNYAVPIDIMTYNEQGDEILVTKLTEAFPIQVPDVALNWSDSSMMTFSVTFAYTQAQLQNAEVSVTGGKGGIQGLSALQKLVKVGTAIQTLATIKRPSGIQSALSSSTSIKNVTQAF